MRFLFVLDSVEAPAAANPRLGRRLAAALAGAGHAVTLLELWDGQTPPPAVPGCRTEALAFADEAAMERALEGGAAGHSPVPLRLARLALHPAAARAAVRQFLLKAPRRVTDTRRAIQRLDARTPFDAVCAVAAPYRAAFALESARLRGKKLLWQMDPYAANQSYRAPGGYDRERRLLAAMDHVFITDQALPDFAPGGPGGRDPALGLVQRDKAHILQPGGFAQRTRPVAGAVVHQVAAEVLQRLGGDAAQAGGQKGPGIVHRHHHGGQGGGWSHRVTSA